MKNTFIIGLLLVVLLCTGWVKNVVKLSRCDFKAPYKAEVVHVVGLFPLAGIVTGWLNVGK